LDYILNQFGTGIRYWICDLDIVIFQKMNEFRLHYQVEWEHLLFDFDFLQRFGFNHWSDLSNQAEYIGFFIHPMNKIEIKLGTKFITRFKSLELLNQETFFPLYRSAFFDLKMEQKPNIQTFLLIQFETGLIGKYKIPSKNLLMDDLEFLCSRINNLTFITHLRYRNQILKSTKNVSVSTSSKVIIIE
jgi:hypothetical protein